MKLNVKNIMLEKNMNKYQFAKLVQIGYPAACAIYDGKTTRISFDVLESICRVLDCTPNDILISDDPQIQRLLSYYTSLKTMNKSGVND